MATMKPPQVPWTTAKLVPEALTHKLHVVEDPPLIRLLGRAKYVDMVVFGVAGWPPRVSHILAPYLHANFFLPQLSNPAFLSISILLALTLHFQCRGCLSIFLAACLHFQLL